MKFPNNSQKTAVKLMTKIQACTIVTLVVPDQIPNTDLKWSQIRKGQHRFVTRLIEEMISTAHLGRLVTFTADKEEKAGSFLVPEITVLTTIK